MELLIRIKNKIFGRLNFTQAVDVLTMDEKRRIIHSFEYPKSLYERSYFQYLCQKKAHSNKAIFQIFYFLSNIFSFCVIVFLLVRPQKDLKYKKEEQFKETNAICVFNETMKDRIPVELMDQYDNIRFSSSKRIVLLPQDKVFFLKIWKQYPLSMTFLLKNLLKIGIYRFCLCSNYNVSAIITANEYSYTSSLMTAFCRVNEIQHINIMHGESVYDLTKTFFCYDQCYVWDDFYIDLYIAMGAYRGQFIIAIPPCLKFSNITVSKEIQYKYYFQSQSKDQMVLAKSLLEKITNDYKVRPHPLYTDIKSLIEIFDKEHIELPDVPISESIMEAKYIVAWDSTVLLQGYLNGKCAIIDDVTNPMRYKSLADSYIMAQKGIKFSKILNPIC